MLSAIRDNNPVMYLVPKALLRAKGPEPIEGEPDDERELKAMIDAPLGDRSTWEPRWPKLTDPEIPIGRARICQEGDSATIVSWGRTLPLAVEAARKIADADGRRCDVIDLRSLYPYDWQAIAASVKRTGRVMYINEDTEVTNFGEHLVRRTCDELFYHLQVRPRMIAGKHVPGIGLSPALEYATTPQSADIEKAIRELVFEQA
jgi:2-oxoisovalerate dehydrogenase E1 component beta subunit